MEDLVSVIIPVYNVEKYLDKCLSTVIDQTYTNLEIILVDDGSTDSSGKLCDEWSKRDKRIKAYHKKNGGLSDARNYGIKKSKGKYISFIDSDDYLSEKFISILYENIIKYDCQISCCSMLTTKSQNEVYKNEPSKTIKLCSTAAIYNMLNQKEIDCSVCNKLFLATLFNDIKFPCNRYFEDFSVSYKLLFMADNIVYCDKKLYFYYQRENSIIHFKDDKRVDDLIICIKELEKFIKKNKLKVLPFLNRKMSALFYIHRESIDTSKKDDAKKEIKKIRKKVLKYDQCSLKNKIAIYISYVNFDLVDKLYYIVRGVI